MSSTERLPADAVLQEVRHVLRQVQASLDAAASSVRTDTDAALDDILASRLLTATLLLKLDTIAELPVDGAGEADQLQSLQ